MVSVAYAYKSFEADTADYAHNGAGDNDWDITGNVLFTHGPWGIARYGNMLWGSADSTHVNLGVACTTGTSGQNYEYCTVGGGFYNTASFSDATVSGGRHNYGTGQYSTVSGGSYNFAIGGGANVGGGTHNSATALLTTVGGGHMNNASDAYATVSGGYSNTASGGHATVGGGSADTASGVQSTVGGGYHNIASDTGATVAGGRANKASGWGATVGGGAGNIADGDYVPTVAGGDSNFASGWYATVSGGHFNKATANAAIVAGGNRNEARGLYSAISGGWHNVVEAPYSAIPFGDSNTITLDADHSYLFGIRSTLTQDSTFMVDMPHIRFGKESGGYEFPSSDGSSGQVMATNGSGQLSWTTISAAGGWTDDGTRVRLNTSSDSVGIGTTTPLSKLHVEGGVYLNQDAGMLILRTPTHNTGNKYQIKFDNNYLGMFTGDDTEDQQFGFYTTGSSARTYDAKLRVFGSAADSWGTYIELTHDGTDGKISTDVGDIVLSPANNVGIGTTSPQGALDVSSTTGALIVPRMTTAQRNVLTAVNGMIIYNTTTNQFNFYEAGAWVTK
jgi:hypothetical protein